jgi:putative transcriptional regulator
MTPSREPDREERLKAVGRIEGRLFTMVIVKAELDSNNPPRLSPETKARLDQLSDDELTHNAEADPDNPPLTEHELARLRAAAAVKRARAATGLSQGAFASRFHINPGRLRDWEQGRTMPDSTALAYLRLIEREQAVVERVLAG